MGKSISSFVESEFKLSEIGLSFGWFEWSCVEFFLKPAKPKALFLRSNVCWPVDWNLSDPKTNPYVNCFVCVLMMLSELWRGCKFSF